VIGCGHWGRNLVRNFAGIAHAHLRWVCDLDPTRLAEAAATYPGLATTDDFRQLLTDPALTALVVATPIQTHFEIARQGLQGGKHLFVEKPLCTRSDQAQELAGLAEARGLVLMVGHLLEYHPAVTYLKRHLDSGALGVPTEIHASRVNPLLGGTARENAMWGLAPHDLSVANYLLGKSPVEVSATVTGNGSEETVHLEATYPGPASLHVEVSWRDPSKVRRMTIVGTNQMAVFDDLAPEKVRIYSSRHRGDGHPPQAAFHPQLEAYEPLRLECLHFLECIRLGRRPRSDGLDGIQVVKVLEAAERSLTSGGRPVPV